MGTGTVQGSLSVCSSLSFVVNVAKCTVVALCYAHSMSSCKLCATLRSLVDQQLHDTNASGDVHGVVLQLLHGLSHAFVSLSPSECWASQHDQGRTQSEWGVSIIALCTLNHRSDSVAVIQGFSYRQYRNQRRHRHRRHDGSRQRLHSD